VGTGDLAPQDRQLVAQHGELDVVGLRLRAQPDQPQHLPHGQEHDRLGDHGWILPGA